MDAEQQKEPETLEQLHEQFKKDPRMHAFFMSRMVIDLLLLDPADFGESVISGDFEIPSIPGISQSGWSVIVEQSKIFGKKIMLIMDERERRFLEVYEQEHSSTEEFAARMGDLVIEQQRQLIAVYNRVVSMLSKADQEAIKSYFEQSFQVREPAVSEFPKECELEAARRFPETYLENYAKTYEKANKTRDLNYKRFSGPDRCSGMRKFYYAKEPESESDRELKDGTPRM